MNESISESTLADRWLLGIDGGGTKTVAWLAHADTEEGFTIAGRGRAGPGNPRACSFEVVFGNLQTAIQSAFADAGLAPCKLAAAAVCLAGAGRAEEQERVSQWLAAHGIADLVQVTGDAEPILAAASPDHTGIALIAGTGSLAWGRNNRGSIARSGGWGYLLGDEGSGYAIAIAGLRAAVQSADGRAPDTTLLRRFQTCLAIDRPSELVGKIYAPEMNRDALAQLAQEVFAAAYGEEDNIALQIIERAAIELANMVHSAGQQLALPPNEYCLAMSGGVLLNQPRYCELVVGSLIDRAYAPGRVGRVEDPVFGAVRLSRRLLNSRIPKGACHFNGKEA